MESASDDSVNVRVASFSYYLDTAKDNSLHKITSTNSVKPKPSSDANFSDSNDPTPAAFSFYQESTPKGGEISIFEADKYFNMISTKPGFKKEGPANPARTERKRASCGRRFFSGILRRWGHCFGNKTVHIHEVVESEGIDIDISRNSIEVFGCGGATSRGDVVATNMERKLSMLTWDAIPQGQTRQTNYTSVSDDDDDDMDSEASSDLFEIENMSVLKPEPSDDHSMMSVVTASAAAEDNSSSFLSDNKNETSVSVAGEMISSRNKTINANKITRNEDWEKKVQKKWLGRLLFGHCKSHKAVSVAENYEYHYKINEKRKLQGLHFSVPQGKSLASRARVRDIDTLQLPPMMHIHP